MSNIQLTIPWVIQFFILMILMLFCCMPQQSLFRDPIIRRVHNKGWFVNYGSSIRFVKSVTWTVLILLLAHLVGTDVSIGW